MGTFRRVTAMTLLAVVSCGGGQTARFPRIELDPPELNAPIETDYSLAIRNTGDAPLTLTKPPTLTFQGCEGDPADLFTLEFDANVAFPVQVAPGGAEADWPDLPTSLVLSVTYHPAPGDCPRSAVIHIESDDPDRPVLEVRLEVIRGEPHLEAEPSPLDLGYVPEGEGQEGLLTLRNTGLGDLRISQVSFIGKEGFFVQWKCPRKDGSSADVWLPVGAKSTTLDATVCAEEVLILRNSAFTVPVKYQAIDDLPAKATISFVSNDPEYDASKGEALEVELRANVGGPCLRLIPSPVDFGGVVAPGAKQMSVRMTSCGDQDVAVTSITLDPAGSADFQVDLSNLGPFNAANPLVLGPGETSREFVIRFLPQTVDKDPTGAVVPDTSTLLIANNSPAQVLKVPVKGLGVEAQCAKCQFTIRAGAKVLADGAAVEPLTLLNLADESFDPTDPLAGGGITKRLWTVAQPPGSVENFQPSPYLPETNFACNIVGEYVFTLTVENAQGCSDTCSKTILVNPPQGIHIELTWNTPTDPDQSDQCSPGLRCGTDMDLHVVHPYARGDVLDPNGGPYGYFDDTWDCYWSNAHPVWDPPHAADPLYQPNLDRDDTDGAGPENFTYPIPLKDKCLRVGVHYFDDHEYGRSYPTIRVFLDSATPIYEKTLSKGMNMLDMWDVGKVCYWDTNHPFQEFTRNGTDPVVISNYRSPF